MSAAAEQLSVAQPALGSQIRQLEQELSIGLLVRHSRGVTPTPAGELLFAHAKKILQTVDEARREIQRFKSPEGRRPVSLGIVPSLMLLIGAAAFLDLHKDMPNVLLSWSEERSPILAEALSRGQFDAILAYNVPDLPGIRRVALLEENFVLVTSVAKRTSETPIAFADALNEELIIGGRRGLLRSIIESEANRLSLKLRIAFEVQSINSVKALLERNVGASIMPYSLAAEELRRRTLVGRCIDRPSITRTLYVAYSATQDAKLAPRELTDLVETIVEKVREALGDFGRLLRS
jgi:LysR family transcriptional regulator, nitrogen assimilation regulatory protein